MAEQWGRQPAAVSDNSSSDRGSGAEESEPRSGQRLSDGVDLEAERWYHIAGVHDETARTLNIDVNGVLDNGVLAGTVPAAQTDANVNLNIAQRTGMPGTFNFQGRIDEVHIFNRALSASEIQNDMNVQR